MNHEINVVEKDPLTFFVSFNVKRSNSDLAELFIDAFSNGLIVAAGSAGANDEVIGERADLVEVENNNVLSLLVESGLKRFSQMVVSCFFGNGFYLSVAFE